MRLQGKHLIFISRIIRDGSGTAEVSESEIEINKEEDFKIHSLSISEKTHIACGFNSYVVRIKTTEKP